MIMREMERLLSEKRLGLVSLVTQRLKRDKVAIHKFSKWHRLSKVKDNTGAGTNG